MINAFKISKSNIYIYILSGLCTVFVCLSWSLSWFSLFLDKFSLSFLVYHFFIIIDGVVSTVSHFRDWLVVHLSSVLLFVLGPFMSVYALVVLFVF